MDATSTAAALAAEPRYVEDVKGVYASLTATRTCDDQWPPPCTRKVFNLAMVKEEAVQRGCIKDAFVRMTITGKLDDIMQVKYPIKLANIFKDVEPSKRKVVLMEGAPGCGKSTLSIFISQQWSEGKLFEEYKAVILVRLRDPAIQEAKSIIDLMPSSRSIDSTVTQQTEEEMRASNFKDVLFILDGWDELPLSLRRSEDSIFRKIIQEDLAEKNGLHRSSVIVTSRPVASGDLQKLVSARVEILGFTPRELTDYFCDCLENDEVAVKELQDKIEENPVIAGSCYLPLNASILVHLFKNHQRGNLPTSMYGVFSLLIRTCVSRHLKEREKQGVVMFDSLDELAEAENVKEAFRFLCNLAYEGVLSDKITFSSLPDKVNTLSILQGVESFVRHAEKLIKSYNFIHLSIQELLAAFFIATWLPADQQVEKFNELFGNARFNAVFSFYAAITKLQTPGIRDIIAKVGEQCGEENPTDQAKVLLCSLLHCLYEARDPSLCEFVMKYLRHGLDLGHTTLNPTDCLCIGYFLSCVCKTTSDVQEFKVNLLNGHMGDDGCRYLAKGLEEHLDLSGDNAKTKLHLNLRWNNLHEAGSIKLCGLLKTGCVSAINLNGNDELGDEGVLHIASHLQGLKELSIYTCGITSVGAAYLAKSLRINGTLSTLNIGGNKLCDEGVKELANALKDNCCLQSINLSSCGMTDIGLNSLADSLQKNNTLRELNLYNFQNQKYLNEIPYDSNWILSLTTSLGKNTTLTDLVLPADFQSCVMDIQHVVNEVRKVKKVKELKVKVQGHTLARIKGKSDEEEKPKMKLPETQESQAVEESNQSSPETAEEECTTIVAETEPISTDHRLPGVDVCAKTTVEVTNKPQCFYWSGYGLKLRIKEDSLPEDMEKCTIDIYASIAGEYNFPEKSNLVSPVFWLRCEPKWCRFTHPITTEIQHCAKRKDDPNLHFVKALCTQKKMPYNFRQLKVHARFDSNSYGAVDLNSFSGVAVAASDEREYVAKLYYFSSTFLSYKIHLVVTWNVEAHLTVVETKYANQKQTAIEGPDQQIEFDSTEIMLDIPLDGIELEGGWKVVPLVAPIIMKKNVDSFKPGKLVPRCQLQADFTSDSGFDMEYSPKLCYRVILIGAKEPHNTFLVTPDPVKVRKRRHEWKDGSEKAQSMEDKGSRKVVDTKRSASVGDVVWNGGISPKQSLTKGPENKVRRRYLSTEVRGSSDSTESSSSVDQESDALNSTETDSEIEEKNTRLKGTGHEEDRAGICEGPGAGRVQHKRGMLMSCQVILGVLGLFIVIAVALNLMAQAPVSMPAVPPTVEDVDASYHLSSFEKLTMIQDSRQLFQAVDKIGDWQNLCKNLKVDVGIMDMLKFSRDHDSIKKDECLEAYVNNGDASWEEVVVAVARFPIRNKLVSYNIAKVYVDQSNYETLMELVRSL